MNTKNDAIQIIGILMKNPSLLSRTDRYNLTLADFPTRFLKYLFGAIASLHSNGAQAIDVIDVENFLDTNPQAKLVFEKENGIDFLKDAMEFSKEENFDYYYTHLKKLNALEDLKKRGIDISDFYCEDLLRPQAHEINARFESLTLKDILDSVKKKIISVEKDYLRDEVSETADIYEGLDDLISGFGEMQDVGLPLQGAIFNEVCAGARRGTMTIRSAASGRGKTRNMVADACYLAFPIRYDWSTYSWEQTGSCEKVLYIATEQSRKEIQEMALAYITGINASKFRYNNLTPQEQIVVQQAKEVFKEYRDNFQLTRIPDPSNDLIKSVIQEEILVHEVEYIFYDYIFISPALLNEFRGFNLRNDELLLLLSTTLKDIATQYNVYVMTATQVNASADDNTNIRNEGSLAGGRATINKADYGFILAWPTKQELDTLDKVIEAIGITPNLVTDVFKVRSGEWTQVRIWSYFDYGTLRRTDLFVTDSRLYPVEMTYNFELCYDTVDKEQVKVLLERLKS
jgi:replicative DNA helicase